jgi:hypothetical protein
MVAANTKYSINRFFPPVPAPVSAECSNGNENPLPGCFSKHAKPTIVSVQLEREPASLRPVQSPPQHGFIHASVRRFGQGVVRHTFLTTRYCGFHLWITGMKKALGFSGTWRQKLKLARGLPFEIMAFQGQSRPVETPVQQALLPY